MTPFFDMQDAEAMAPCAADCVPFSRGLGTYDSTPVQHMAATVDDFIDFVLADRGVGKGEQWIASAFRVASDDDKHRATLSMASAIGRNHRCRDCALPRNFVGLDADQLTPEQSAAVVEWLHSRRGVVYATASHTPMSPRLRALLMLDEALARSDLIRASVAVRAEIDDALHKRGLPPVGWDESCDRPEQPLYLPLHGAWAVRLNGALVAAKVLAGEAPMLGTMLASISSNQGMGLVPAKAPIADAYAVNALHKATAAIAAALPGTRNNVLNREAYSIGGMVGASRVDQGVAETLLIEATRRAGWDDDAKNCATVRDSVASGMTAPRVDGLPDQILFTMGSRAANDELAMPTNFLAQTLAREMTPFNDDDFALAAESHPHLFGDGNAGIFPLREVTVIAAPGREGKTYGAVYLAAQAILGREVAGLPSAPCQAVVYSNEDDRTQYARKILAIASLLPALDAARLKKGLIVPNLEAPGLIESRQIVAISEKRRPVPAAMVDALIAVVRPMCEGADPVRLIIFETGSTLSDADEDNLGLKTLVAALKRIAVELNVAAVIVHHTSQAAAQNLPALDVSVADIRGGTALAYNARQCFLLVNLGSDDKPFKDKDARTLVRRHVAPLSSLRMSALICLDTSKATDPSPVFLSWEKTAFGPAMIDVAAPDDIAGATWPKTRQIVIAKALAEREKSKASKSSGDVAQCIDAATKLDAEGKAPTVRAVSLALGHGADWAKSRLDAAANAGHLARKRERVPNCRRMRCVPAGEPKSPGRRFGRAHRRAAFLPGLSGVLLVGGRRVVGRQRESGIESGVSAALRRHTDRFPRQGRRKRSSSVCYIRATTDDDCA